MGLFISLARMVGRHQRAGASTIQVGIGAGLQFDPATSNPDYAYGSNELPVQQVLAQYLMRDAVFYDVGANVGFLTVIGARLVGPRGIVYAFEPVPANAAFVRSNAVANGFMNVEVIEKAVTSYSGSAELALASYSGGAVLAEFGAPPDAAGTLRVDLTSIDDLVERSGLKPPAFVKIDVEGAELSVLQGMERTAARHRPMILYELDDAESEPLQRKQAECEHWLRARGYRVAELPESYIGIHWIVKHFLATPIEAG